MIGELAYNPQRDKVPVLPKWQRERQGRHKEDCEDLMSKDGARGLAWELNEWWHTRGYKNVHHTVEECVAGKNPTGEPRIIFVVRSNLVNGLPPVEEMV